MSGTWLRRTVVIATALAAAALAPASATTGTDTHADVWRPWTRLLDADPYTLPSAVGRLHGLTPTSVCAGATSDLRAAVAHLADVTGQANAVRPGVRLDATAEGHVARLTDCLATATTRLPVWDGERRGPAPDALRAEWLGVMQDLLTLARAVPALTLPASCVDLLCLVQTGGAGPDTYTTNAALVVDSGGADIYRNNAGGGYLLPAAALVLDQGVANDQYVPTSTDLYGFPTIGSGYLGGIGVLVDEGGSDTYRGLGGTMGSGYAGGGMLLDEGTGGDLYDSPWAAGNTYGQSHKSDHGAGVYGGFGFLVDQGGNDRYLNAGVDSIGWGGAAGTGLLIDVAGSDTYTNSPGATGDVTGGCCTLASGVSIGTGEVGGVGAVLDGGGSDAYACTGTLLYGCQGTSYFGNLGLLYDNGGNDSHVLGAHALSLAPGGLGAAGVGGVGAFVDTSGVDSYSGTNASGGHGQAAVGVFFDLGGSVDSYSGFPAPLVGTRGNGGAWVDGLGTGVGADR